MGDNPSQNGSTTSPGSVRENPRTINALFETLRLTYPYFQHGKTKEELHATMRLWASQLRHIPSDTVEKALSLVPSRYPEPRGPTIGEFLSLCKRHPADLPYTKRLPAPATDEDKMKAKQVTWVAFSRRLTAPAVDANPPRRKLPPRARDIDVREKPSLEYTGTFPYQEVADAVEIPELVQPLTATAVMSAQTAAWSELKKLFEAKWREHCAAQAE